VLVSDTDDRAAALAAVNGSVATQVPGDLTDAFALASARAGRLGTRPHVTLAPHLPSLLPIAYGYLVAH
jgi:hypothetical protein